MAKNGKGRGQDNTGRSEVGPRFVQLEHWFLDHPAALDLSGDAFKVMVYMARRFNGYNNGAVGFGVRSGCVIKINGTASVTKPIFPVVRRKPGAKGQPPHSRIKRALDELEAGGFIVCTQPASFNQKRLSREWRLSWLATGTPERPVAATKEFAKILVPRNSEASVTSETIPPLQCHQRHYELSPIEPKALYSVTPDTMGDIHSVTRDTHISTMGCGAGVIPLRRVKTDAA